jgi:hypothetical protein
MKRFALLGALAGLLILTAVVAMEGIADVAHILEQAGWPLLWLVPIHLIALWFDAYGWRVLLAPADPEKRAGTGFLLWWRRCAKRDPAAAHGRHRRRTRRHPPRVAARARQYGGLGKHRHRGDGDDVLALPVRAGRCCC